MVDGWCRVYFYPTCVYCVLSVVHVFRRDWGNTGAQFLSDSLFGFESIAFFWQMFGRVLKLHRHRCFRDWSAHCCIIPLFYSGFFLPVHTHIHTSAAAAASRYLQVKLGLIVSFKTWMNCFLKAWVTEEVDLICEECVCCVVWCTYRPMCLINEHRCALRYGETVTNRIHW